VRQHWFLPETPDVQATLLEQADVTISGGLAFAAWADGDAAQEATVRAAEHEADAVRRRLTRQLREAFSTPLDQEDLFALSENLDAVLNAIKNLVREADVLEVAPDEAVATMAGQLLDGLRHLRAAFEVLTSDADAATREADEAVSCERAMEKSYRTAMRELLALEDLRLVVARRELYRRLLEAGERLAAVAERVWYAVVKEA